MPLFWQQLNMEHWVAKADFCICLRPLLIPLYLTTCPLALIDHPKEQEIVGQFWSVQRTRARYVLTHFIQMCRFSNSNLSRSPPQNGPLTIIKLDSISREDFICLQIWINLTIFYSQKPRPLFGYVNIGSHYSLVHLCPHTCTYYERQVYLFCG